jgi:glycosyltransferase involved in cell wall biosynthesis
MIIIDTAFLGGPGKGLLQLIRNHRSERYSFLICTFRYRKPRSTEFIDSVQSAGYDIRLLTERFRFDPFPLVEAYQIARRERISLIQSHGYKGHVVASILASRLRLPWFAMTHGWTWESWKVRLYNRLERHLLKRADVAGAVSPPLFRELLELRGPERPTRLILNAVDAGEIKAKADGLPVRQEYKIPSNQLVIGVFGRLSPEKGCSEALEALHRVWQQRQDVSMLFVGDGPMRATLVKRVAELGLKQNVILAGYQTAMRDFYEAIDLLLIPSLSEGLPNVLLEAMALAIPSVSTRVGAIPDIIDHGQTGWLVTPGDVNGLARQLSEAIAAPNRLHIGAAAQESLYPRFSATARADQFVSVYDDLLCPNRISTRGLAP